jgi:sugar/nucleoside kinase (ribokinase family)
VNSTGAGDVFNAGFVFGWLQGLGPKACLQLGNSMACFKIQRDGIELPEIKEMNEILRRLKR